MGDFSSTVVFRWLAAGDAGDLDAFDELPIRTRSYTRRSESPRRVQTRRRRCGRTHWPPCPTFAMTFRKSSWAATWKWPRVIVTGTITSSFAGVEGTGRSFRIDQAVITHLTDGKVVEAWEIADIAALQAQVTEE